MGLIIRILGGGEEVGMMGRSRGVIFWLHEVGLGVGGNYLRLNVEVLREFLRKVRFDSTSNTRSGETRCPPRWRRCIVYSVYGTGGGAAILSIIIFGIVRFGIIQHSRDDLSNISTS